MTEVQQIWHDVLDRAKAGQFTEFHFLSDWGIYKSYKKKYKHYKWLVKVINKCAKKLLKKYCSGIVLGNVKVITLLAYRELASAVSFYQQELNTFSDMVAEYKAYLSEGNLMWAYFGVPRTSEDMRDFRNKESHHE